MNYYGVKVGKVQGVFDNWSECEDSVKGFSGAKFCKFKKYEDAYEFVYGEPPVNNEAVEKAYKVVKANEDASDSSYHFYIEGAFDEILQISSYGLLFLRGKQVICRDMASFRNKPDLSWRDKYGLLMGVMKACQMAVANGVSDIVIHYSFDGVAGLADGSWKPSNELSEEYVLFIDGVSEVLTINFERLNMQDSKGYYETVSKISKLALKY